MWHREHTGDLVKVVEFDRRFGEATETDLIKNHLLCSFALG